MRVVILFLISLNLYASNWMPISKIEAQSNQAYQLDTECQKQSSEQCLDVGNEPEVVSLGFAILQDVLEDNLESPIWGVRSMVELCEGEEDCQAKALAKACAEGREAFYNAEYSEVWCNKIVGYNQKPSGLKTFSINTQAFNAYKAQRAQVAALNSALGQAKKARECGSSIMDVVLVRNAQKNLTTEQVKNMVLIYAPIKGLLETGSLVTSKEEVEKITPDGLLVTQGDKEAVIAAIDGCLE